jgi:hypothetical protein
MDQQDREREQFHHEPLFDDFVHALDLLLRTEAIKKSPPFEQRRFTLDPLCASISPGFYYSKSFYGANRRDRRQSEQRRYDGFCESFFRRERIRLLLSASTQKPPCSMCLDLRLQHMLAK